MPDEAIHGVQTSVDDLGVAVMDRRENLRVPNRKCSPTSECTKTNYAISRYSGSDSVCRVDRRDREGET